MNRDCTPVTVAAGPEFEDGLQLRTESSETSPCLPGGQAASLPAAAVALSQFRASGWVWTGSLGCHGLWTLKFKKIYPTHNFRSF